MGSWVWIRGYRPIIILTVRCINTKLEQLGKKRVCGVKSHRQEK